MDLNDGQIRLFIILGYMSLLLLLGFAASRFFSGTKKDYMLASHSIGPFLLLMSIFGTTMTAFALVGSSGEAYKHGIGVYGMLASSSGIIHSLCFFVIGVKIYRFGRMYGYTTQVQFFRDRLESDFVGLLLFPILVALVIPYLLLGIMGGGMTIEAMTAGAYPETFPRLGADGAPTPLNGALPQWLGALLICSVVLIYVFFGGMRGTTWANTFQTIVFMVLGVVTFVVLANKIGNGETFLESLRNASAAVGSEHTTRMHMSQTKFFTYLLIPLSVGMFPHLFQHWLTAKSAKSFKLPVVMHPIFIMIVWVPCVLIGVWATTQAIPEGIKPNAVLPFLVKTQVPPVLAGLLTAGILAAIMSSLDSQFLCLGSMFTTDIVGNYMGEDRFSDKAQVWIARVFIIIIVAVTYALAMQGYRSVFTLGVWCFSGFAALFPLVFAALYWRGLTAAGAVSGILAAAGSWFWLFRESGYGANGDFAITLPASVGNAQIMPVVAILLCSMIAMVLTSLMTSKPSAKTLARFFPEES